MATPLTFGIPLKFGPNLYNTFKGRPTFPPSRERAPEAPRKTHTLIIEKGLQWAPRMQELLPRQVVKRWHSGSSFSATDQGRASTDWRLHWGYDESLAFRAFDKIIIFGHWLSKT